MKTRLKMIESIEEATGCKGIWGEWSSKDIQKLYVFLKIGAPHYFENAAKD